MAAAANANVWVGLEVEHPTRVATVLSYQPKCVAVVRAEDRRVPQCACSPAFRLHQRHARWGDPGPEQATHDRIERVASDEDLNAALHWSIAAVRHDLISLAVWATELAEGLRTGCPPRTRPTDAEKCIRRSLAPA